MSEKIKITLKELTDLYDIEGYDNSIIPVKETSSIRTGANSEFEQYTEDYDKKEEEELKEDLE